MENGMRRSTRRQYDRAVRPPIATGLALLLSLSACHGGKDDSPADETGTTDTTPTDSTDDTADDTADLNHLPPAPAIHVEEDTDGALHCVLEATPVDPDGEPVTVAMSWASDTRLSSTGDTVLPADAARAAVWTCTAVTSDAVGAGEPSTATWTATGPTPRQYAFVPVMEIGWGSDLATLPDDTLLVSTMGGDLVRVDPVAGTELGSVTVADWNEELLSVAIDPSTATATSVQAYYWTSQSCRLGRVDLDLATMTATNPVDIESFGCALGGGHSSGDLLFWEHETDRPALYLALGPSLEIEPQDDSDDGEGIFAWYVDPDTGSATPALDTPFANPANVAIGLRNPWRAIDCGPYICTAEPGYTNFEEVNLYSGPGMNFGAGEIEGPDPDGLYDPPTRYWEHDDPAFVEDDLDGGGELRFVKVPMLGVRVSGTGYSGRLDGVVLYGEFYDGWIRGFKVDEDGTVGDDVPIAHRRHIMSMTETSDGTVWAVELGGTIQKLILRGDRPTVGEVGSALSETTYFDGGVDYNVRFPLWSNGAGKDRMVQIPAGETIDTSDPDAWVWPVGTKLWKNFGVDGENIETRLIEKTDEGWVAGVYLWDGDDAYLTDGTRQELLLTGGGYTVPSTETCAFCHAASPGREWPIGPEAFQLGEEGLAAFSRAGLFSQDPGPVPEVQGETDPRTIELRSELHGNCAYCHHEGGLVPTISETTLDFSYSATSTGLVGARVNYYDDQTPYGPPQEYLVVPGDTDNSVLLDILEATAMPPVAVWRQDTDLMDEVERWIDGL